MWTPDLESSAGPRYLALADAIARDIASGTLRHGERLPTHRELADRLGITVGTVTRGFAEAERRGLTVGEVGRGTFVREAEESIAWFGSDESRREGLLEMSLAMPWRLEGGAEDRALAESLATLSRCRDLGRLLQYDPDTANLEQRRRASEWLRGMQVPASPESLIVTSGVQHGLTVLLCTILRPGDTLLAEEVTYPAVKSLSQALGLSIRGVAMDEGGMIPDALDRACREGSPRAVYLMPNLQNPTGIRLGEERREAIADIAREHGIWIIEDEVHRTAAGPKEVPIAARAPERTFHLTSLSKSVAFGLRVGFLVAPESMVDRLRAGVRTTLWMPPPLMVEIATRWLADGTALSLGERRDEEMAARHEILRRELGEIASTPTGEPSIYVWMRLPEPWRGEEFVAQAKQRGVRLAGSETFAVGQRNVPHAVRISVSSIEKRDDFERAVSVIAELLQGRADACLDIV
ncbi:MAG: PLP-dependent aminotransferase family protein [Planctomycetota bacterium]